MTTTETTTTTTSPEALGERLFSATVAALDLLTIHLGNRLGLYTALREGTATPPELAERAGIHERYAREWLEQQAAAALVACENPAEEDPTARRYTLPEGHAIALCDVEHPAFAGAFGDFIPVAVKPIDALVEAFRTGGGVPYAAYELHDAQAAFTRPIFANEVRSWIEALPGVHARLDSFQPVRVADVGCGNGWFAIHLAKAYPTVEVDGFDLDEASIAAARKNAADSGVADRVRFEVQDVSADGFGRTYDLVTAIEMLHDVSDPVGVLRAMDRIAEPDGVVLVIDEKVDDGFSVPADDLTRMLYGFSVLHCLPAGLHTHDGESAATGTVMRPSTVRRYAAEAGLPGVEILDVENDFYRFYRLR